MTLYYLLITDHSLGDEAEAFKSALSLAITQVKQLNSHNGQSNTKTLVYHYTDAPPHHLSNNDPVHPNFAREVKELGQERFDFVNLANMAKENNLVIHSIMAVDVDGEKSSLISSFFVFLATITQGIH